MRHALGDLALGQEIEQPRNFRLTLEGKLQLCEHFMFATRDIFLGRLAKVFKTLRRVVEVRNRLVQTTAGKIGKRLLKQAERARGFVGLARVLHGIISAGTFDKKINPPEITLRRLMVWQAVNRLAQGQRAAAVV